MYSECNSTFATNLYPTGRSRSGFDSDDLSAGVIAQVEAKVAVHLGLVVWVGPAQRDYEVAEPVHHVRDLLPAHPADGAALDRSELRDSGGTLGLGVAVIQLVTITGSAPGIESSLVLADLGIAG